MNESPGQQDRRSIRAAGATAIVAGSMLGVGIFLFPRLVALEVPSTGWFLALWAFGGLVALAGAVAYAELGAMMPRAGGDYAYLRHTFGPSVGFAAGWLLFVGVFGGSIASMSAAVCTFQLPMLLDTDLSREVLGPLTGTQLWAIGLVIGLTTMNCLGVRVSTLVQILVTLVPFGVLTAVAVYALASGPHDSARELAGEPWPVSAMGLAVAFLSVYFAYAGWNAIAYVGGEIERPGRNIPLALLGGTGLVTVLYLVLCAAFVAVLGFGGVRVEFEAGTASATALLGSGAELWVAALIAIALLGSVNATVLQGSRIAYAMARDRSLHKALGTLNSRSVPARSLWVQAILSCVLIATGTFEALVELTGVAMFVMAGLSVLSLFVLRVREPDRPRPYRATMYPELPALFLVVSVVVIGLKCWQVWDATRLDEPPELVWYPLLGLLVFVVVWFGHRLLRGGRDHAGPTS